MDFFYQLRVALTDPAACKVAVVGAGIVVASFYLLGEERIIAPLLAGHAILWLANGALSACRVRFLQDGTDYRFMPPLEPLAIRLARYALLVIFMIFFSSFLGDTKFSTAAILAYFCFSMAVILIVDIAFRRRAR